MPNPSEGQSERYIPGKGCPDIMLATKEDLVAMSKSEDKLLGCAARDELRRREKPGEPASPELCEALGINADEVAGALPERSPPRVRLNPWAETEMVGRRAAPAQRPGRVFHDPKEEMLKRAAESLAGESVKTKEAVVTTVATYLANKEDRWWARTSEYREKEMFFVIKMLVHTYSSLEEL